MRHFYRCTGCLEIFALADKLPMAYSYAIGSCGICQSPIEYMGRVKVDRLVTEGVRCKCDDRCTSARGPLCTCQCGGVNHGSGLAGYVRYETDRGPVPILQADDPARTARALAAYQAYAEQRDRVQREFLAIVDRRHKGEFVPRPDFDRMLRLQRAYRKALAGRTQAGRIKTLSSALAA